MFEGMKTEWRILRDNPPGRRFQERYCWRKYESPSPAWTRLIKIAIGIILIPIGMALWFLPGPGWLTIIAGMALLAGESRWTSRLMDRTELALRRFLRRLR